MSTSPEVSGLPPINEDLVAGVDVGGTKVHIMDTVSTTVHRFNTEDYSDLDSVLHEYFTAVGARPARIAVGMAGPRDDETGEIKLSNADWPAFNPHAAAASYGIGFSTANDMVATTAGVLQEPGVELLQLKPGAASTAGTKAVVALSTGIGAAAAMWDSRSKRYVILAGEGGHIGFQPKDEAEMKYLQYLQATYPHPHISAEHALSGKHGIDNLVNHLLEVDGQSGIAQAITRARAAHNPVGAVLHEYATEGAGTDKVLARDLLGSYGAMVGSYLRDVAVIYKASGGVYLTGSVALALGEYLVENTTLIDRFTAPGTLHDSWLEKVPIRLVTNPNVAAVGTLALAQEM